MGKGPTIRAQVALFAFAHALGVQAQTPAQPEPALNISSTIVRALGLRAEYPVSKLGQSGCERELTRIRGAEVASIAGRPVSIGAAASLFYYNGMLSHVPDVSKVPPGAILRPASVQRPLADVGRFFSEGIQSMRPEEYRYLQRDLVEVRRALIARAESLGTAEAGELVDSFRKLEGLVETARLDAQSANRKALMEPKTYEGAKELFKTIERIRAELPHVMRLASQAEAATAASARAAATVSAEVQVVETSASGLARGAAAAEAETAAASRSTGETASRATQRNVALGRGMVLGANVFLALAGLMAVVIHAFDTPEREARRLAAEGARIADAWNSQPDASDAYVFGGSVSEVCARAVSDPRGFGQVVSQKMGAIEYWDALSRALRSRQGMMAYAGPSMEQATTELQAKHIRSFAGAAPGRPGEAVSGDAAL